MAKTIFDTNPVLLQRLLNSATTVSGNRPTFGGAD